MGSDLEEVIRLIESGADVNWRDSIGETALFGAAAAGQYLEVVRYLLSVGASCNMVESTIGYTPLHWAASHGNLETIQILVEAGADPTVADYQGRLPIDVAHRYGKGAHVSYLKSRPPRTSKSSEADSLNYAATGHRFIRTSTATGR